MEKETVLSPAAEAAQRYEDAADELERAVQHLRTTARHFRDMEVPRACAHAFAAQGHLYTTEAILKELAVLHAARSLE